MRRYTYKHGLPFGKKLDDNLKGLNDRVLHKFASLAIIDGGIGQGKTTLAVHIADRFNALHGLPPINLEEQLALGGKDFTQKMRKCYQKKLPVLIYDEAGDFNKRGSLSRFNAMINRTFETFRAFQIIVILVLPSFYVLDQDLFDKQIPRLLIHLRDRGDKYGNYYAYGLYRMLLLRARMGKLNIKNFAFTLIHPNFMGQFLDLDPARNKALDRISTNNKISVLQKSEIEIEGLKAYREIAEKLCRSHEWVRRAVNELKIKPKKVINRVKYFNEDIIDILSNHIDIKERERYKRFDKYKIKI